MKHKFSYYWSDALIGLFFICTIIMYAVIGQDSYIAVHDNLDLFQPQFQMMKDTGTFFAHNVSSGFLGGISRDVLPSEWSFTTVLYMIFPSFTAYIINYICKILIALVSGRLLAGEVLGEDSEKYHTLINLCAFAYGVINFFPCFGVPFASIPLVVYLLLKIERAADTKKLVLWYIALFAYPFVSYFSYLGIFILAYMVVALIWISIVRKRFDLRMLIGIIVLSLGCVAFEYRLFNTMLFSDEVTIRSTMVLSDFTLGEAVSQMWDVFKNNTFHADALTGKVVMPVCMAFFFVSNIVYICRKQWDRVWKNPYNLTIFIIVFDSVIYGLYTYEPMRKLVETLVPPLEGWQFDRTSFFNPFLWVCALFMVGKFIQDNVPAKIFNVSGKSGIQKASVVNFGRIIAVVLVLVYIVQIMLTPTRYNDLRATAYNTLKSKVYGNTVDDMNYREFYGEAAFDKAMEAVGYNGEWSVAYGFYPAVLEYNGINTLDGYLGYYSQEYKEQFRKIIAPALDRVEASRIYFDDWGARAYLFSGSEDSVVSPYKSFVPADTELYIDVDAFKDMGGKYIFSRFELTGEVAESLEFKGAYSADGIPYTVYVYEAD